VEPDGLLPHSQLATNCPYPEPARSSPYTTSHFLEIHLNIILPSKSGSSKWSLSHRFPSQNPVYTSPLPHTCYKPSLSNFSRFDHPKNIWRAVLIIKLFVMYFSALPRHFVPLRSKYSHQHPILKHPQRTFLPQYKRPSFTPIQNNRQNYSSVYLNPLKPELNPICYLLALLGAHHFLRLSRIRVKLLTFRLLMSCIYGAPILDVSRSHTTTQHSR